jgi:hypothetical protein
MSTSMTNRLLRQRKVLMRHNQAGSARRVAYATFTSGDLRRAALTYARYVPYLVRTAHSEGLQDGAYRQANPYEICKHRSLAGLRQEVCAGLAELAESMPDTRPVAEAVRAHVGVLADTRTSVANVYHEYVEMLDTLGDEIGAFSPRTSHCRLLVSGCQVVVEMRLPTSKHQQMGGKLSHQDFLVEVSKLCAAQRQAKRTPTHDEAVATHLAYVLLARGVRIPFPPRPWGNPGFREVQTYMSITDPGEGHLWGTAKDDEYLHGVIVHVEHLERGLEQDRKRVEAYRRPAPLNLPRVRLHVGGDAPCSSYVGRPVFEGDFASGRLKAVHAEGAACSEIFGHGYTECKVAINMPASQAVEFMQALAANVARDQYLQSLSAAFCLNDPLIDDRPSTVATIGQPREIRDRFEIGLLAIELTALAGLDKVAWDGANDIYPSTCVLEQLTEAEAITLVHRAHERGLLTYFSGGFRLHHLAAAVRTGADGIGVGGAQILRHMDPTTGHHGPFKAANITNILAIRDEVANSTLGLAAHLLARLDQLFFEKSITRQDDSLRRQLFADLARQDEAAVEKLLDRLSHVRALPPERGHPLVESAQRLLAAEGSSLAARAHGSDEWHLRSQCLRTHLEAGDFDQLAEELRGIRRPVRATSLERDESLRENDRVQ